MLPGATHVCADSHAPTVGALGALAFGCGTTELVHILATQTMALARPRKMRIRLEGVLAPCVSAKDVVLHTIAQLGIDAARGHAVEFSGARLLRCRSRAASRFATWQPRWAHARPVLRPMTKPSNGSRRARLYLSVKPGSAHSQPGAIWPPTTMQRSIRNLRSTAARSNRRSRGAPTRARSCRFRVVCLIRPRRPASSRPPSPRDRLHGPYARRADCRPSDQSRVHRLMHQRAPVGPGRRGRGAARPARCGRCRAVAVPGSTSVKRAAEARGLDQVFRDAGFAWHASGCSLCAGGNRDAARPGTATFPPPIAISKGGKVRAFARIWQALPWLPPPRSLAASSMCAAS